MTVTKKSLLVSFFRSYPLLLAVTFFAGTINSLLTLLLPISFGKYYQLAYHSHSPRGKLLDNLLRLESLQQFLIYFCVLVFLKGLFTFFEKYFRGYSSELFSKNLRERLMAAQLSFRVTAYDRKAPGKFLLRYSGDLSAIQRYVMKGVISFANDVVFLSLAFGLLLYLNPFLTFLTIMVCLTGFLSLYWLNRFLQRITVKRRNIRSEMLAFVSTRLNGILTVKAFNREPLEEGKFQTSSEKLFGFGKRYFAWFGFLSSLIPVFLYATVALVFYFAYQQRLQDKAHFPAHDLLVYIMVLLSLLPYLRRMLSVTLIWQIGNVSISKALGILNTTTEQRVNSMSEKFKTGVIDIFSISFDHSNGKRIFNQFSATIREQSITRISGAQGSGKSTLFKLLLGLYPVSGGSISIDDTKLDDETLYRFRRNITVVSEEFPLLGKTIFEAVSYSRKHQKRANALELLNKYGLNLGVEGDELLDYRITPAGSNLSLGQRKQLLLVRALLTRKRIILLDEPFSGMDEPSKNRAVELLNALKNKHTIVVISTEWPAGLDQDTTIELPILA